MCVRMTHNGVQNQLKNAKSRHNCQYDSYTDSKNASVF